MWFPVSLSFRYHQLQVKGVKLRLPLVNFLPQGTDWQKGHFRCPIKIRRCSKPWIFFALGDMPSGSGSDVDGDIETTYESLGSTPWMSSWVSEVIGSMVG